MVHEVALPGGFTVSDDPSRMDIEVVHGFLSSAYWAVGRPRGITERAIAHSLCLGLYAPDGRQVGFARVITDRAIRAHLADVFVLPDFRGGGRGKAIVAAVLGHPELGTVKVWTLNTDDAHELNARFGFVPQPANRTMMVRAGESMAPLVDTDPP